jgi:hypothetical protein
MQLDDWVLCRIYKKTNPQLMYSSSPPYDAELSMDGRGQQQEDHSVSAAAYGRLPRPPSISDYLVDYSTVSELFESIPAPQLGTTTDAGSSSSGGAAAAHQFLVASNSEAATGSSLAQQSAEDYPNTSMEMLQQHAASMAANNSLSVFGPGYPSLQDRI